MMTKSTMPSEKPMRWGRAELVGCVLSMVAGLVLAVLPHAAMVMRFGTLDYVGDADDAYYLALARAPYYGESLLRDPYCGRWERVPSHYPWALVVPAAKTARALGLSLIQTGLVWR